MVLVLVWFGGSVTFKGVWCGVDHSICIRMFHSMCIDVYHSNCCVGLFGVVCYSIVVCCCGGYIQFVHVCLCVVCVWVIGLEACRMVYECMVCVCVSGCGGDRGFLARVCMLVVVVMGGFCTVLIVFVLLRSLRG